ncbi:MAG TPA: DUF2157 domain-containing protein [Candidatus Methylomirabilis sp.]|nr:DUF2157 domain-containing protein [Candidatus Methylomirabilis sp.]
MAESSGGSSSDIRPEVRERILREGLATWRDQGLISAEQHEVLLARVAVPARPARPQRAVVKERKLGRGVTILINLGAIILAAGLIIFFASNWIEFGRAAKIASLFALTLFFYLVGFELTQEGRWNFPKLGLALIFLGCVMFGVDILLLALIYDLTAEHAWSLLMDWAVWLAIAYLVRSRLILFLGLIGVVSWFGAEVGYLWGGYWIYLGRPLHFIGLGACLLAIAGIHAWREQRSFSAPYAQVGLLLIYLSTLILSIFDVQRGFRAETWSAPLAVWLMLLGPYLFALTALVIVHLGWRRMTLADPPALVVLFLLALMLLSSVIAWTPGHREFWFILLLTLLTGAGIYLGIAWESSVFLNTGIVFFAVNVYTRFYEYFWDAMPKSLFFIIGGATLIAGGIWVERVRRQLVRQFAGGGP